MASRCNTIVETMSCRWLLEGANLEMTQTHMPADRKAGTGNQALPDDFLGSSFGLLVGLAGADPRSLGVLAGADQPAALARQGLGACGIAPVETPVPQVAVDCRDALGQKLDLGF